MNTTKALSSQTESYWNLIKDATNEVKLRLITLLSQSVSHSFPVSDNNKDMTKDFLDKFAGAWEGPESAEEIIANIRSSRQSRNEPVLFD